MLFILGFRILGIGRNQYLALVNEFKTQNHKRSHTQSIQQCILPRFPLDIQIESWWKIEIAYVLESDVNVSIFF